jgi:hypothetical protein
MIQVFVWDSKSRREPDVDRTRDLFVFNKMLDLSALL